MWDEAQVLVFLGALPFAGGDHERAAEYFEQVLELARQIGDPFGMLPRPTTWRGQSRCWVITLGQRGSTPRR